MLSDFCVIRKGAVLAVSSSLLASMAIGEQVDPQELGGWRLHAETTGFADVVADTDEEALAAIRTFLVYLPSHANEAPPEHPVPAGSGDGMRDIAKLLPAKRTQVYDVRRIIRAIVDKDSLFELKARFGKVAVTALSRIGGRTVGIVANNPLVKGGALDTDACEKITSFLVLCDSFNIPLVMFVDTPGLRHRHRGREKARARQDHELHARAADVLDAQDLCDPAQELRAGLSQHGRRPELRRGGGVADGGSVASWTRPSP